MRKVKATGILSIILSLSVLTCACTGCGQSFYSGAPTAAVEGSPVNISVMLPVWGENISSSDPALVALEKYAGAKFDITSVPVNTYKDKVNVSIASQQLPDAFVYFDIKTTTFEDAVAGGMFWEVGPYLKDYSSFRDISPEILLNSSINGKTYGLPRERPFIRRCVTYRLDWVKKLGLPTPDSLENIYNDSKAFVAADLGSKGKGVTTGFALVGSPSITSDFMLLEVDDGGPNNWGIQDGKLIPSFMMLQYLDTMKWLKKMYDEKLINQDFATEKDAYNDSFEKQQSGMIGDWICSYLGDPMVEAVKKADPALKDEDIVGQVFLKTAVGMPRIPAETGFMGLMVFPKSSVKNSGDLKKILTVFNKIDDKTAENIMQWGVEGIHYTMKDGKQQILNSSLTQKDVNPIQQLGIAFNGDRSRVDRNYDSDPGFGRGMALAAQDMKYVVPDMSLPYLSPAYSSLSSTLDTLISDSTIKFIMGAINEDQWNEAIGQWKGLGGEKVIDEYNAAFKNAHR